MNKKVIMILLALINLNIMFLTISIIFSSAQIASYIDELTPVSKLYDNYVSVQSNSILLWIIATNIAVLFLTILLDVFEKKIRQYFSKKSNRLSK